MNASILLRSTPGRLFHTTPLAHRKFYDVIVPTKEASQSIVYPSTVQISVHRIPNNELPQESPHGRFTYQEITQHKEPLRKIRESSVYYKQLKQETAIVEVRGPLGVGYVPVPEWIDLAVSVSDQAPSDIWHGAGATGGPMDNNLKPFGYNDQSTVDRVLTVSCVDPLAPMQHRHWGFYRRRIARYVQGVTEGFALPVRFVGVGYRAQLEQMDIKGPKKHDALMFESWLNRWQHLIELNPYRRYMAKTFKDSLWAQMIQLRQHLQLDTNLYFRTPEPRDAQMPLLPLPKKLVMKLGVAHDIEVIVPPFIQAANPSPTNVVFTGIHMDKMHEIAVEMQRNRKPEPYKGKGIFIGDETIKLKQKKIK